MAAAARWRGPAHDPGNWRTEFSPASLAIREHRVPGCSAAMWAEPTDASAAKGLDEI